MKHSPPKTILGLDASGTAAGVCLWQEGPPPDEAVDSSRTTHNAPSKGEGPSPSQPTGGPSAEPRGHSQSETVSRPLFEETLHRGLTHSETLLPLIARAFTATGLTPADLDLIAVTAGPGSFTGLRIGLATAKGLSFPHGTPLAPVSTLEAVARAAAAQAIRNEPPLPSRAEEPLLSRAGEPPATILAALNARRGEVYWAAFSTQKGFSRLCEDTASPAEDACAFALSREGDILMVGDGAEICYNGVDCSRARLCSGALGIARGAVHAALAAAPGAGAVPGENALPVYLRLSQAERERAQKEADANE